MQQPIIYQLIVKVAEVPTGEIASLLENCEPAPLAVSFYETTPEIWEVAALYDTPPVLSSIETLIQETLDINKQSFTLTLEELVEKDWVSHVQSNLKPVQAGRFIIYGEHDRESIKEEPFALEVNAAQAFGTAHHGTTKGCLIAIDKCATKLTPKSILDLGTGTGVLAMAAKLCWPNATIIASDIDPIATTVATQNAELNARHNQLPANAISFITAAGLDDPAIKTASPFDLIIANILAKPLIMMAKEITTTLQKGGMLILSGILATQADDVITAYQKSGLEHQETSHHDEWVALIFKN